MQGEIYAYSLQGIFGRELATNQPQHRSCSFLRRFGELPKLFVLGLTKGILCLACRILHGLHGAPNPFKMCRASKPTSRCGKQILVQSPKVGEFKPYLNVCCSILTGFEHLFMICLPLLDRLRQFLTTRPLNIGVITSRARF